MVMALYGYRCDEHGDYESLKRGDTYPCPTCYQPMRRLFTFTVGQVMQEHYSPSFGCNISSLTQARELAKKASDKQSKEQGTTVNYSVVDALDHEAHGIRKGEAKNWQDAGSEPTVYQPSGTLLREQKAARDKMKREALARVRSTTRDSLAR